MQSLVIFKVVKSPVESGSALIWIRNKDNKQDKSAPTPLSY